MHCSEIIGLDDKNQEIYCPAAPVHDIKTPEGVVRFCGRHFAEYRLAVEKSFNHVEDWAKRGVGW